MSIQFGRWTFDGAPKADDIAKADALLSERAAGHAMSYKGYRLHALYYGLPATKESRFETQPHIAVSGNLLLWDGRLDNRQELLEEVGGDLSADAPDISIVAAVYARRAESCFSKLLGDWALTVWNPFARTIVFAKDFLGTRHLYYRLEDHQLTWSTLLDPLVLCNGNPVSLEEEYIAGWLSCFPAQHLSPFRGIYSVPPASYVKIRNRNATVHSYWDFNPEKRIYYRADTEYEAHFRSVFGEAVRRRVRADGPVFAELSGGMDSSSIVCMADRLLAEGVTGISPVETLSYFDDRETTWNERPFFTQVEQLRGRAGFHIDARSCATTPIEDSKGKFMAAPGSALDQSEISQRICEHLASRGARVLLSGIGGDEALGGVPNPRPELADLATTGAFSTFAKQSLAWALSQRRPIFELWKLTFSAFLPHGLLASPESIGPPRWLNSDFMQSHHAALHGYYRRLHFFGARPSFQENLHTLEALRRQFACHNFPNPNYERRFPFLDRDLWEFVLAIPREQILRARERRSLMRRALAGILPDEIRNRRRKAFVARSPLLSVLGDWSALGQRSEPLAVTHMGIVDAPRLFQSMENVRRGRQESVMPLVRLFLIERWLRRLDGNPLCPVPRVKQSGYPLRFPATNAGQATEARA